MDAERFETLLRALSASPSRRSALRLLAGATLGSLLSVSTVPTEPTDAGKGKGNKGKRKGGGNKGGGKKGGGKNGGGKGNGNPGPTPPVSCVGKPDGTACGGGKQCSGEVCATPPACSNGVCSSHSQCCSDNCDPGLEGNCAPGVRSKPCHSDFDCRSRNCVGFVCAPGVCPANGAICQSCGIVGDCIRPIAGGVARCSEAVNVSTEELCGCESHQECIDQFGAEAFCGQVPNNAGCVRYCADDNLFGDTACFIPSD